MIGGDGMGWLGVHLYGCGSFGNRTLADRQRRRKATDRRACGDHRRDPHRRIWEQQDESFEAFKKRVEAEAEALRQTSGV